MKEWDENIVQTLFSSLCVTRAKDPIFSLAIPLRPDEIDSCTREVIAPPNDQEDPSAGPSEPAEAVQGGWFGRGYRKGKRKKKAA